MFRIEEGVYQVVALRGQTAYFSTATFTDPRARQRLPVRENLAGSTVALINPNNASTFNEPTITRYDGCQQPLESSVV